MRWFWIDQFLEFESGRRAVAIKNISLAEDYLHDHYPGWPVIPGSLVVEGLAQTGGLLVGQYNNFNERVVLAKLRIARFHLVARPGDTLVYTTTIEDIRADGAFVKGVSHLRDRLHAEVELYFAHLDRRVHKAELFDPVDFLCMLKLFKLFEVGRNQDGSPLEVPARLLEAEAAAKAR